MLFRKGFCFNKIYVGAKELQYMMEIRDPLFIQIEIDLKKCLQWILQDQLRGNLLDSQVLHSQEIIKAVLSVIMQEIKKEFQWFMFEILMDITEVEDYGYEVCFICFVFDNLFKFGRCEGVD